MNSFFYGGSTNIGCRRDVNEDFIGAWELGEDVLLAIIADGAGSKTSSLQPAAIAGSRIREVIERVYRKNQDLFFEGIETFLEESFQTANQILGAFKMGNEELYAGFGTSITACVFYQNKFTFCHAGNTRLYRIRVNEKDKVPSILQLTQDHTKATRLLKEGIIEPELFYAHPDRLTMTSGLGVVPDPVFQVFSAKLKVNDIFLLTTDGIHYAIRPEAMTDIIAQSGDCSSAADALIEAAKMQKYMDNMSAMLVWKKND